MIALRPGVVQEWSGRSDLGWTLNSKWNLHEWKRRKGKSRQWKQPGKGTKQIWVCFVMWTVESQSGKRGVWRLESRVVGRADLDKVQWVTLLTEGLRSQAEEPSNRKSQWEGCPWSSLLTNDAIFGKLTFLNWKVFEFDDESLALDIVFYVGVEKYGK